MRLICLAVLLASSSAIAAPDWTDATKLVRDAAAVADPAFRACSKAKTPWKIALIVWRDDKTGASNVAMPFPPVGDRGLTDEESCLLKTVATIEMPPLPAEVSRIVVIHTVDTKPTEPELGEWRDVAHELGTIFDADRRTALAACSKRRRTVRVILDVRHGKTRAWLPAWQFHSESRDGSTPAAERPIKACLTRELARWTVPILPADLNELEVAIPTS
jgi:hypothetical protein